MLVTIIAFNLFLNPLNPLAAQFKADRPFVPQSGDALGLGLNTADYNNVQHLISLVGSRAIIAVSPLLFTFLANDVNSYPLDPDMNWSNLPFNYSSGTQYVLLLDRGVPLLPPTLNATTLYNTTLFGVRAWIPSTSLGGVILFERGYTGAAEEFGPTVTPVPTTYWPQSGLVPGNAGSLGHNPKKTTWWIRSKYIAHPGNATPDFCRVPGEVFGGPTVPLPAGSYNITLNLSGNWSASCLGHLVEPANTSVVGLEPSGFEETFLPTTTLTNSSFPVSNGSSPLGSKSMDFTLHLTLPYPVLDFQLLGVDLEEWFGLQVNYVNITPVDVP